MKSLALLTAVALPAFVASLPAADLDLSKLPAPAKQQGVTFDKHIKPLFDASCIRCHGEQRPKGGLRLDSAAAVLKGGEEGKVVTAGDSARSRLVIAISGLDPKLKMPPPPREGRGGGGQGQKQGPPPAKPLTPEEVGLVRAWIDQGAN